MKNASSTETINDKQNVNHVDMDKLVEPCQLIHMKNVPNALRKEVWFKYNMDLLHGECYCCKRSTDAFDFHCGHVISHADNGPMTLENLRPICATCNLSMGTENLYAFKSRFN